MSNCNSLGGQGENPALRLAVKRGKMGAMKFYRPVLFGLGFVAIVLAALHALARPAPEHPFFAQFERYPLVMGHADDSGSGFWPGNTMLYLEGIAGLGVDVLEMDLHMSRDGRIVLIHDATVDRTSDGSGRVSDLTLAELQALEVGVNWTQDDGATYPYRGQGLRIPTLEEVFQRFPDYPMIIEIKQETPSMAEPLCALIRQYGMAEKVIVPSFRDAAIQEFRAACPEVATAAASEETRRFVYLHFAFLSGIVSPPYHAFQVPETSGGIQVVTPRFVRAAHRANAEVHVWTVNDPADMQRLLDMGVDGIMTDRPDILLALLGRTE